MTGVSSESLRMRLSASITGKSVVLFASLAPQSLSLHVSAYFAARESLLIGRYGLFGGALALPHPLDSPFLSATMRTGKLNLIGNLNGNLDAQAPRVRRRLLL